MALDPFYFCQNEVLVSQFALTFFDQFILNFLQFAEALEIKFLKEHEFLDDEKLDQFTVGHEELVILNVCKILQRQNKKLFLRNEDAHLTHTLKVVKFTAEGLLYESPHECIRGVL